MNKKLWIVLVAFVLAACAPAAQSQRADIPAPSEQSEMTYEESGNDPLYADEAPVAEGDIGYEVSDELAPGEAKELYQNTIAEVEEKLGKLPIDDSVPSGEFGYDRYMIQDEALSEASDALYDRQAKQQRKLDEQSAECDSMPLNTDAEFAAYEECFDDSQRDYDKLMKEHDEENDWLAARQNQLWNEGQ